MKNLICILLIACGNAGFAQLEGFVQKYADTTYNDRNLIDTIIIKELLSSESRTATFFYYNSDKIKYIEYVDHEGYAQYQYN